MAVNVSKALCQELTKIIESGEVDLQDKRAVLALSVPKDAIR